MARTVKSGRKFRASAAGALLNRACTFLPRRAGGAFTITHSRSIDMRQHVTRGVIAAAFCLAALVVSARPSSAATIAVSSASLPPGGSAAVITISVTTPNNDNTTSASPNLITLSKTFAALGFFDIEFLAATSQGTTEYFVNEQTVSNATGTTWTDFHFALGFGLGASFVPSNASDSLDFDTPDRDPVPTSNRFATLNQQSDQLDWTNGLIATAANGAFTFSMDVPDWSSEIPAGFEVRNQAGAIIGYRFTLREFPTTDTPVPEPASMILLGTGVLGVLGSRRLRKREG
jgi:hypothetical protein